MAVDANGGRYFDAVGGLWCTNIGLGRREMADAISEQVMRLAFSNSFVDMTNDPAALLSARLAQLAPGDLNRVHFTTGGSTAIDTAARMVQYYQHCMGRPGKTRPRGAQPQLSRLHLSVAEHRQAAGRPRGAFRYKSRASIT